MLSVGAFSFSGRPDKQRRDTQSVLPGLFPRAPCCSPVWGPSFFGSWIPHRCGGLGISPAGSHARRAAQPRSSRQTAPGHTKRAARMKHEGRIGSRRFGPFCFAAVCFFGLLCVLRASAVKLFRLEKHWTPPRLLLYRIAAFTRH
jgi:hypothetical protein